MNSNKITDGQSLAMQFRTIPIGVDENGIRASVNEDDRSIELSFSSETPCERWYGDEILSHEKKAVLLERLNTKAALLVNHDTHDQVGVVEKAYIRDGKGHAKVRFGNSARANEIYQDVKDGIRSLVSVGYRIHDIEVTRSPGSEKDTVTVLKWSPHEISIVSVPADIAVGVGRAESQTAWPVAVREITTQQTLPTNQTNKMEQETKPATVTTVQEEPRHTAGTRSFVSYDAYVSELGATAKVMNAAPNDVAGALARNLTPQEFAQEFTKLNPPTPLSNASNERTMSDKDAKRYDLGKALRALADNKPLSGLEAEVQQHMTAIAKREGSPSSIFLPNEFHRAANATTATAGGFTVATQTQPLIDRLVNKTALDKLGVTSLDGLTANLVYPVLSSGTTAYWVSETATLTESQPVFAQKSMVPHRLGAWAPFSRQLLTQSNEAIESIIRNTLMVDMDLAEDLAGLEGTGADGQPRGVKNSSPNATVTFSSAAIWADVVEFETGIAADNADGNTMGFALSSATVGKWKTILKDAGSGSGYLIDPGMTANGYNVVRTNQITGDIAYFGDWRALTRGRWAGEEITVDTLTLATSGQIKMVMNRLVSFLVTQPLAFNISTDSAAQ